MQHLNRQVRRFLDTKCAKDQKVPAFLCIDATNNPKVGEKSDGVSNQYSHLAGRNILCWCLVTAVMVVGNWTIPFSFRLYRGQADCLACAKPELFRTKVELAVQLVREWQPPQGTPPFILVDNWYRGRELLSICQERNFTLIGGIKPNRTIKRAGYSTSQKLGAFGPTIEAAAYQSVTIGKQQWPMVGFEAELVGGYLVKVVASKAVPKAEAKALHLNYWVCSDTRLSVRTIMELYSVRWEIETFHKQAKQLLGLNDNQCMRERSVRRMWTLLLIAYSYLVMERVDHSNEYLHSIGKELPTLGQVQREHQTQAHKAMAEWVYSEALAGTSQEVILAQIRA